MPDTIRSQAELLTLFADNNQGLITAQNIRDLTISVAPIKFNVKNYGLVSDGTTDNTTAFNNLLSTVYSLGGGEIYFPSSPNPYLFNGQIIFPNDSTSPPKQRPITLQGAGSHFDGRWTPNANGGSILDLRYNGGGAAKIVTRGTGRLKINGLVFADNSVDSLPFLLTTNTTLLVSDCTFQGNTSKTGIQCDQDAIILGGTTTTIDGTDNAPFQGYGTVISSNYFHHIRRAVYGRVYANGTVVRDNTISTSCGSNLAGGACIEFIGNSTDVDTGNLFSGNLFEMVNYPYGFKLTNAVCNSFICNNFFDVTGTTIAYYRFENTATLNMIIAGYSPDSKPQVSDAATSTNQSTLISAHQGQQSLFTQPVTFSNATGATFSGPANFTKGAAGVIIQPASATGSESSQLLQVLRSTAEGTNPGTNIFQLLQNGTLTIGGTNGGNIITPQVSWTGGGRNWIASGVGAAMTQDSGTGGSNFDLKNYAVRFYDHNGGALRLRVGAGKDGFDLGATSDVTIQRDSSASLAINAPVKTKATTTALRPSASTAGAGAQIYDTDLQLPLWSNGTVWRDAAGTTR